MGQNKAKFNSLPIIVDSQVLLKLPKIQSGDQAKITRKRMFGYQFSFLASITESNRTIYISEEQQKM